jgi:hypothetical protein
MKINKVRLVFIWLQLLAGSLFSQGKPDSLIAGSELRIPNMLKSSREEFLMYRVKANLKTIIALIEVEYIVKENEVHIIHRTTSTIPQMNGLDSSIVEIKTFAPKFFYFKRDKQEETVLFEPGKIISITGKVDSVVKVNMDYKNVLYNTLTINELLGRIKLKLGYSFNFATYNPMMKSYSSQYYTVAGEEKMMLPNNHQLEVWRLETKQKQGSFKIWVDKKTQRPLKQVSEFNGIEIWEKRIID